MVKKRISDDRADTRGGGWVGIPQCVVDSPAYRDLTVTARAVLIEIVRRFNGYNNGGIVVSQRQIAEGLKTSNFRKIVAAVDELMTHGLIGVPVESLWKERKAREYRLTFVSTSDSGSLSRATNDYDHWRPTGKFGADKASAEPAKSAAEASSAVRKFDDEASTRISAHRGKLASKRKPAADEASSLIVKPYPDDDVSVAEAISSPERGRPLKSDWQDRALTIGEASKAVHAQLVALRRSGGPSASACIAVEAGIGSQRVQAFIDGSDALEPASILRLCRALRTEQHSMPH
jgi:hypothetical protein